MIYLNWGVDRIEITPDVHSLLSGECDLSRSLIQHASAEVSIKTALDLSSAYASNTLSVRPSINPFFMPDSELRILASEDLIREDYRSIFGKLIPLPYPVTFCAKHAGFAATALTMEWIAAGGKNIVCSFMGCGGYAPLEEVLLALKVYGYPLKTVNTSRIKTIGTHLGANYRF